jgi:hypothetical protein
MTLLRWIALAALAAALGCSGDDDGPRDSGGADSGGRDAGGGEDAAPPRDGGGDLDSGVPDGGAADAGPTDAGGATDAPIAPDAGPLGACEEITDVTMRGIVYDGPRVPPGFYTEPDEAMAYPIWASPCSPDLDTTRDRAAAM